MNETGFEDFPLSSFQCLAQGRVADFGDQRYLMIELILHINKELW